MTKKDNGGDDDLSIDDTTVDSFHENTSVDANDHGRFLNGHGRFDSFKKRLSQIMPFFSFSLFPCCKPGTESTNANNASDLLITPGSSNSELKAALDAMKDEMKAEMDAMKVALAAIDAKFEAAGITSFPPPTITELPVDQRMDDATFSPLSDDDAPVATLPPSGQFEASSLGSPDSSSFWHQASSVDQTLDFADRQRRYDLPTNMPK